MIILKIEWVAYGNALRHSRRALRFPLCDLICITPMRASGFDLVSRAGTSVGSGTTFACVRRSLEPRREVVVAEVRWSACDPNLTLTAFSISISSRKSNQDLNRVIPNICAFEGMSAQFKLS